MGHLIECIKLAVIFLIKARAVQQLPMGVATRVGKCRNGVSPTGARVLIGSAPISF